MSVAVTLCAAVVLACQLRHVHDSTNLSRDIGQVGRVLAGLFGELSRVLILAPQQY